MNEYVNEKDAGTGSGAMPVESTVRFTTYEPGLDMGVRGFDSVIGVGRSEPTSPERRKRAGNQTTANSDEMALAA